MFRSLREKLLGKHDDRRLVRRYEDFLSKQFFSSLGITLIPREGTTDVYMTIGSGEELSISHLGDGMQTLIICLYPVFMEPEPALFFIEEPDTHLHPSMQRALLSALTSFPQHQFFLTTHSNHALDIAHDYDEVSIFRFTRNDAAQSAREQFRIESTDRANIALLQDLGARPSSVLLANTTIWVEGITDRLYLRMYMKKYLSRLPESSPDRRMLERLREDFHYSFVEYQGAGLDHWAFEDSTSSDNRIAAPSVCATALVIADGDVERLEDRVNRLRAELGERFILLNSKEVENLLPEELLRRVVAQRLGCEITEAAHIERSSYAKANVKLHEYLDAQMSAALKGKSFSLNGGLRRKTDFCREIVQLSESEDVTWTLPEDVVDLCKRIFAHICKHGMLSQSLEE